MKRNGTTQAQSIGGYGIIHLRRWFKCLFVSLLALVFAIAGCDTQAKTGTLAGAGIGALAGQAIGGSTGATLAGAAIGAGAGYIIGNEGDKKRAAVYNYNTPTPLTGTRWKVARLDMDDPPIYDSITVEFKPNGEVVTTRYEPGGTTTITEERYRIVGDTLIINKPGYIVNAKYRIQGGKMTVTAPEFTAVLQKMG
ncbi:MAG: hypothetical protein DRP66_08160 [Planctomycetota bacterium]|nr:MAG: hypothetical protein DRP66_08160 [Planctomycetota bacterium]